MTSFIYNHKLPLLLIASLLLFFYKIWTSNIFFPDELIIQSIAYEMAHGSGIIVPHLNGIPFLEKPPLLFWQIAPLYYFFPPFLWLARLWMPIYAVGLVYLTYKLASHWFDKQVGFTAALLLSTSSLLIYFTKSANYDILNAFFMVATIYFYNLGKQRKKYLGLASLSFALGLLDRSFLALAPVLIASFDYFLSKKKLPVFHLILIFIPGLLAIMLWGFLVYLKTPDAFIKDVVILPFQLHLIGHSPAYSKNPYLFLTNLYWYLPFFFLFCFNYYYVFKSKTDSTIQLLSWIFLFLAIQILSLDPDPWHFLPVFPALAIAAGRVVSEIDIKKGTNSFAHFCFLIIILLAPVGLLLFNIPQSETITEIQYAEKNSPKDEPIYFWKYQIIYQTKFFPSRNIVILDDSTLKSAIESQKIHYVLARDEDVADLIQKLPKGTISLPGGQLTLLQLPNSTLGVDDWRRWYNKLSW
jgi:4-amino-4-deoxy-L-arabinose transferase-like glycosyltransferase